MLSGSAVLFACMMGVNGGNYLFNLLLSRWLGPGAYGDVGLLVTLLLTLTMLSATLARVSTRFVAAYLAAGQPRLLAGLRAWLGRRAWLGGAALACVFIGGALPLAGAFHLVDGWPLALVGLGMPCYLALAVARGTLVGQLRFGLFGLSMLLEMGTRLLTGVLAVALGWGVYGVAAGLALSIAVPWLHLHVVAGPPADDAAPYPPAERRAVARFARPVLAAFAGQMLIGNSDVLIVKHFYPGPDAGRYTALALIGRVVFFGSLSVVTSMFPLVAQRRARGEAHAGLLARALGLVAAISAAVVALTGLAPDLVVALLFGDAYRPIAPLLWIYAAATGLYACANVLVAYGLSLDRHAGGYLLIAAGLLQCAALWRFHRTLREVALLQLWIMAALLGVTLALHALRVLRGYTGRAYGG